MLTKCQKQELSHSFPFLQILNIFLWEKSMSFILISSVCFWSMSHTLQLFSVDCIIFSEVWLVFILFDFFSKNISLPSGEVPGFWENTELILLFLLLLLLTDKVDWIFLCIFSETGDESFLLSAGICLTPLWIPLPLLRPTWPFWILPLSSSLLSNAEAFGWGKRWGCA